MKRTPMLPRKPSLPSPGPTTFTPASVASIVLTPFDRDSSVARNIRRRSRSVNILDDSHVRSKTPLPDDAPRRARGADAQAHHREHRRAPRGARPRADLDQRDRRARRRAPLDRLPPLPGRGGAVRRLLVALARGEPAARPARLGGDRRSRPSAPRPRSRALRASTAAPSRCTRACCATSRSSRPSQRLLRDFHDYLKSIEDILMAGRGLRGGAARRTRAADRPRARLPDLALAHARAGAVRRRRRPADVPARAGGRLTRLPARAGRKTSGVEARKVDSGQADRVGQTSIAVIRPFCCVRAAIEKTSPSRNVTRAEHVERDAPGNRDEPRFEFVIAPVSERLSRIQVSWTASSASFVEPSIR